MKKLVIDCGGTKIEYAEFIDEKLMQSQQIAFNGNVVQNENNLKTQLLKLVSDEYNLILIGIAGYRSFANKESFHNEFPSNCFFMSDIDLAALALLKNKNGLIAVIGTGSVLAHRNNKLNIIGGYGHILNDCGSGYHFGKVLFLEYMKQFETNQNNNFTRAVEQYFSAKGREILIKIINNEKQELSKLSKAFMDHPDTKKVFDIYFSEFLDYIKYYLKNLNEEKIIISGSIINSQRFKEQASKYEFIQIVNVKNIEAINFFQNK